MEDDYLFHPLIKCLVCEEVTKDWGWVLNPLDDDIYGICLNCHEHFKQYGKRIF